MTSVQMVSAEYDELLSILYEVARHSVHGYAGTVLKERIQKLMSSEASIKKTIEKINRNY